MKRIFTVLAVLFGTCSLSMAQTTTYAEASVAPGGDFGNTSSNYTANINAAGTFIVSGTVTTAADGQDRFGILVASGYKITNVSWTISGGSLSGQQLNFAGLANPTTTGSITGLSYPLCNSSVYADIMLSTIQPVPIGQ